MRTQDLMPALAALAMLGCAELAAIAPAVTIDVVATQREASSRTADGEAWSWGIGARLAARLDPAALGAGQLGAARDEADQADSLEAPPVAHAVERGTPRCRIASICAWEVRARARAIARARALSSEEEP